MDLSITLPNGARLDGGGPVVVVGPNGSGKTRQTRNMSANVPINFVNALRNTRVAPELPAMGMDTAKANYDSQLNQARYSHWELTSEFDFMLSRLLAQRSMAAIEFARRFEKDPATAGAPAETPLGRVEKLWSQIFPGRELTWGDWKPIVVSHVNGSPVEYTANQMSDGEKAALFLAGRAMSAESGILVVDEPETHLHSLLAVKLWNALEEARPDIRFVYITHDLTFALSRQRAQYVLASPTAGLREVGIDETVPSDVAEALLGSASLSFYASRVVFCEGEDGSLDNQLYGAWFNGADTVVRSVGSCQHVMRCVDALSGSGIAQSLDALGIIDRDYHAAAFLEALPSGVSALPVHEIESLFCLPEVVRAMCSQSAQSFDEIAYRKAIVASVSEEQKHAIIVDRWKARLEPHLGSLVASVSRRQASIGDLVNDIPRLFDHQQWNFSPRDFLSEEESRVEAVLTGTDTVDILRIVPGKQLVAVAARIAGLAIGAYKSLAINALSGKVAELGPLGEKLESALSAHLPVRQVAARVPDAAL